MNNTYRLLIGSIGDDIHSVGMALLTLALRESGMAVRNLGIGNTLDDFFHLADDYDAVLISCNNGHADLYLEDFPQLLQRYRLGNDEPKLWYLGGNLSVKEANDTIVRKYRSRGFDYVAAKPVGWQHVLDNLKKDFYEKGITPRRIDRLAFDEMPAIGDLHEVTDEPMSDQEFATTRQQVLSSWPTGSQVLDADIKGNHTKPSQNLHHITAARLNAKTYAPLLQPRTGVAHIADEIEILKLLEANGMNVSSIQLDAASRKNMYAKAEEGVRRSEPGGISFLNGYPVEVHGVPGVKQILASITTPFQIRAGSPDHRLVHEIALAGGASSLEGGFICYLYPYDKRTSPTTNLRYWKYVDKLSGMYQSTYGITINREYFGPLTTSLIEPSIPICINIVQAVLSAKSGVRCISVGLAEQGNRVQDIAAIQTINRMTRRYLAKYGFTQCTVSTVYHHYMAAFPADPQKAEQLILNSSTTGALAKATRFMIKTPVESYKIPTRFDNAAALRLTQDGVARASDIQVDQAGVQRECRLLESEVTSIMTAIETLGNGSLARGAIRAFQEGILDIPFSPSRYNRNRLITARDCDGAIRFVNPELLPFDVETTDFHLERMHRRMVGERLNKTSEIIDRDLTRIWKGEYVRWPLDGCYVA